MKYRQKISLLLVLAVMLLAPALHAQANVRYTNTASLLAQIQVLKAELATLEQQLLLRNTAAVTTYTVNNCYTDIYGRQYCANNNRNYSNINYYVNRIEVSFSGSMAQVRVVFNNGSTQFYAYQTYNTSDVATLLAPELNLSPATILGLITQVNNNNNYFYGYNYNYNYGYNSINGYGYTNNNIWNITVNFSGSDAYVIVQFRNGATDRFTLNSVYRDQNVVVNNLANRYNMSTGDIWNVISFN